MLVNYYNKHNNLLIPWDVIYPECKVLRKDHPQTYTAMCYRVDSCPKMDGCQETIAKRVHFWFDKLKPSAKCIFAYFKVADSVGAVYFLPTLEEPKLLLPTNRYAFKELTATAKIESITLPDSYINIHNTYHTQQIIPVDSLIR